MSFIYIVLLLGGLIFFHELGHFIFARWMGVHVVTFSIGMGPTLFRIQGKPSGVPGLEPTEYVIAALPIGGYVRMFGDDPDAEIPAEQRAVSLNHKEVWRRFLVMVAGPAFNLVLPFIIFFFLLLSADKVQPSLVGTVDQQGPAGRAGLVSGDLITAIDDEPVDYWWQLQKEISARPEQAVDIRYDRGGEARRTTITTMAMPSPDYRRIGVRRDEGRIGVMAGFTRPIVTGVPGSAAAAAGVHFWDEVVAVDGVPVTRYSELGPALSRHPDRPVSLTVRRYEGIETPDPMYPSGPQELVLSLVPDARPLRGLMSVDCVARKIHKGSPAEVLGLRVGDVVVSLDDRTCPDSVWLLSNLREDDQARTMTWIRDGVTMQKTSSDWIAEVHVPHPLQKDHKIRMFGLESWSAHSNLSPIDNAHLWRDAAARSSHRTFHHIDLTFWSVVGLFGGAVDFKELSGPVGIAHLAAHAGERGWSTFFGLMAFLSISLGLLNLLPIPLLDGGHILFLAIEAIRRRPVSLRTRQLATYVGLAFILVVMVVVFRNDLMRVW